MNKVSAAAAAAAVSFATLHAGKNIESAHSPIAPVTIPFYIGIGGIMAPASTNCPCAGGTGLRKYDTINFGGILRVGYDFHPYFGLEARVLRSGISKNFATTTHYGLYAKPQVRLSNAVHLYGLIGYGHTKVDCQNKKTPLYEGNGLSFGAGAVYDFAAGGGQGWGVFVDFQNLLRDAGGNKVHANVFSAGVRYGF